MIQANQGTAVSVRRTSEIEATSDLAGRVDRYLIESADSGGSVALLEQILPPRALAAPVHRHSREDEYSVVLEGRLGVFQDDEEVFAAPGDIVFKPRGHWHTFWNAGDGQLRILEGNRTRRNRGAVPPVGRGGSTTRQRCRRWPPNTAVRSTSSAPCHWSSGTASSSSLARVRRCRVSRGAGGNAGGRLPAQ